MGINGLLRNLHPLLVPPPSHHTNRNNSNAPPIKIRHNIQQFAHKSLAIDASSWLFKSAYTCSDRLVESIESGIRDPIAESKYTNYMITRCRELISRAKIAQVYLVFDGIRVPLKAETNAERESKRRVHLAEARRLKGMGRHEEARERYNKCVKGTEEMSRVICAEVERVFGRGKGAKVQCVFSPYEADAQLAKLCVDGVCHAVVTEDSDVLVYSAACRKPFPIIYKLDRKDGSCDVVTMDWLLNPKFLPTSRRKRRQRDDSDDSDSENEGNSSTKLSNPPIDNPEKIHYSEIDYDDDDNMIYAPIRRTLPLPLGNVSTSKSNSRARRSTSGNESAAGTAFLTTLRSFAHKEVNEPGSGCRLFVQACVLSGCDYVSNRLSKVGPVTAFKLVKDSSHRKHDERFDRVLKSLPRGSILQQEATENKNIFNKADVGNKAEDLSVLCGSYNDMKEKYLELLTKSEAIFYYHLVKEQASNMIVPLISHEQTEVSDTNISNYLIPPINKFNSDLSFLGSIEEAMKTKPFAEPLCVTQQPAQQNDGGWISVKRTAGNVKNTYKKLPTNHSEKKSEIQIPQKGTLQHAFGRHANQTVPINPVKSMESSLENSFSSGESVSAIGNKYNPPSSLSARSKSANHPATSNLFSSFALDSKTENKCSTSIATPNSCGKTTSKIAEIVSQISSPIGRANMIKFDYMEAVSARKEPKQQLRGSNIEANDERRNDNNSAVKEAVSSNALSATPLAVVRDNIFDYEIVEESPPVTSADQETHYSKYFEQPSRSSPRRVSTSPLYKHNLFDGGKSSDDAIDLTDNAQFPIKLSTEAQLLSQTSYANQTVNKRPFKSPYPTERTGIETNARKKPRQSSSGALLAGFATQKENTSGLSTRQRLAARNANSKKFKVKRTLSIQSYLSRK